MAGTSVKPSGRAANSLAWPLSAPTRIGLVHPHSRIEAAIWAICWGLCVRGLALLGISRWTGHGFTWMLILIGLPHLGWVGVWRCEGTRDRPGGEDLPC
jgi:hypothetical protein